MTHPAPGKDDLPSVSIVIVNLNGMEHLSDCLDSIAGQDYPAHRFDVVVVDNASTDGSLELLADRYPWATVLPQDHNTGFAPAVNVAAAHSHADCIALVNSDSRLAADWLSRITERYDPDTGYVCVAGRILDWEGTFVDFVTGVLNFHGMGAQPGFRMPVDAVAAEDGHDLLFACGGAMLCNREVFLEAGGFDAGFFAYYEDVDFGWRLWTLGHRVRFAADAVSFHKHHGTSSRFPVHQRILLFERNALRMVLKNYDEENLLRVLGPSLMLLVHRAVKSAGSDRADFDIGAADTDESEVVGRLATCRLHAVVDVLEDLDAIMQLRRDVQARRRRSDEEVLALFGEPFKPLACDSPDYLESMQRLIEAFSLDELFTRRRATNVTFVAYDRMGTRMAGPAIRCWELARAVARHCPVTVVSMEPIEVSAPGVRTVTVASEAQLRRVAEEADVVVVYGYGLETFPFLADVPGVLVADMVTPWVLENLEYLSDSGERTADQSILRAEQVQAELLDAADFALCASERQRDYWLGMLTSIGRLDRAEHANDPRLRSLIDVVSFGCPDEPFPSDAVLEDPRVRPDELVVMWLGGTWSWFDPVTVLRAFERVRRGEPRAKLVFLGLELTRPDVEESDTTAALRRAVEVGDFGDSVLFVPWVPYEERTAWLVRADVGVYAADDVAEVRLAFRTRLLDHLWAGLPTVSTEGDTLGERIAAEGGGVTVPPNDPDAMAEAVLRLLRDDEQRAACAKRMRELSEEYRWSTVAAPLVAVAKEPWRWTATRAVRPRRVPLTQNAQALLQQRDDQIVDLEARLLRYRHFERLRSRLQRSPAYTWARRKGAGLVGRRRS